MDGAKPVSWAARVTGRVQGVYYRAFTRDCALELGVNGWVRNEPDGSVSALLQHLDEKVLAYMTGEMRQGPPGSRVDDIEITPVEPAEIWDRFEITR